MAELADDLLDRHLGALSPGAHDLRDAGLMELPIDSMFSFCSDGAVVVAALLEAEVDEAIRTCGRDVRSRQASREVTKI
jgi:hypothetical protein